MARKKDKKKNSVKKDRKKKELKKKKRLSKKLQKKKLKKKEIKKEKAKKKDNKKKGLKKEVKSDSFSDHSSNYNVREAVAKLRSLSSQEQVQVFTRGEERLSITRSIPAVMNRLK